MSSDLPVAIKARHSGRETVIFIAMVNGEEITQERFTLGNGDARRRVAGLWAQDDRLWNGTPPDATAIEHALEDAEQRVRESLDRGEGCPSAGEGQVLALVRIATEDVDLFHDAEGVAYATVPVGEHRETHAVRARKFRRWLSHGFFELEGRAPNTQALVDALTTIEGVGLFRGEQHTVYLRLAQRGDAIYIDLGDEAWSVVRVSAAGWEVLNQSPVKFRRARGMLPFPRPVHGGDISELRNFLNLATGDDFKLVVGWLIGAFRPRGPYPVLVVSGEPGAAKTTTCRVLRKLADPNVVPLRSSPRDERDLVIAAGNAHVLGYDNISRLNEWLSDALCRISTGGGFGTRALFTDSEEMLFDGQRPILLNGIGEIATRSDLLDRSIQVMLPAILAGDRRDEETFWAAFHEAWPRLFGAILDAISAALREFSSTRLTSLPRMADFARWVVAAETSLPWESGGFLTAYSSNRAEAHDLVLEASPVGHVLCDLMEEVEQWSGSCTDLLGELDTRATERMKSLKSWPKHSTTLGGILRRIAPNLRAIGVDIEFGTEGRDRQKRRRLIIRKTPQTADPTVPVVPGEASGTADSVHRGQADDPGDDS